MKVWPFLNSWGRPMRSRRRSRRRRFYKARLGQVQSAAKPPRSDPNSQAGRAAFWELWLEIQLLASEAASPADGLRSSLRYFWSPLGPSFPWGYYLGPRGSSRCSPGATRTAPRAEAPAELFKEFKYEK